MIPIIPYSHYYWVGGPPKVFLTPGFRSPSSAVPRCSLRQYSAAMRATLGNGNMEHIGFRV